VQKNRAQLSDEVQNETLLEFAYSYAGSVGIVLTLPGEAVLFESHFDQAIATVFEMTKADTPDRLKGFSRRLGIAPIKAMYAWANDLAQAGFGADIKWRSNRDVAPSLFIQRQELQTLTNAIQATSEEQREDFTRVGSLLAVHVPRRTFTFQFEDGERTGIIHGTFADAISRSYGVELPSKRYRATIRRTTKTFYSTEQDEVKDFLVRLETI